MKYCEKVKRTIFRKSIKLVIVPDKKEKLNSTKYEEFNY